MFELSKSQCDGYVGLGRLLKAAGSPSYGLADLIAEEARIIRTANFSQKNNLKIWADDTPPTGGIRMRRRLQCIIPRWCSL